MPIRAFSIRSLPIIAIVAALAAPAEAAVYAVGPGPGCTHATIQAAINAASANPGEDFIRIPHSQIWNGQALVIDTAQTLWLEGFWSDCNTIDTGGARTTLDGGGGAAAPVLRIEGATGSVITLDSLTLRNGDVDGNAGKGGGIYYRGNGSLVLANSSVINNVAGLGGGMYLEGTGVDAVVVLHGGVGITGNTARDSGGGVFAQAVRLHMTSPNSIIAFNEATGYTSLGSPQGGHGGGLVVSSTDDFDGYATVGSAGVGNAGAIHGNKARFGGGVAVLGRQDANDKNATLQLHATVPGIPAKISENFASVSGGGLYLRGFVSGSNLSSAHANLWNVAIEGNAAAQGSAMSAHTQASVHVGINGKSSSPPEGAMPCPVGEPCTRIVDNIDQDSLAQPTGGATIYADGADVHFGVLIAPPHPPGPRGTLIHGNRGGRLIDVRGDSRLAVTSVLVAANEVSEQLIRSSDDSRLFLYDSTIAGNSIGGDAVFESNGHHLGIARLLIWQPGTISLTGDAQSLVRWTLASEAESLGGGLDAVAIASPRFVDPQRGDYTLRAASPAIDYAPWLTGLDHDAWGNPRDENLDFVPRPMPLLARDVGAFERQDLLPLLYNSDFATDTHQWSLPDGHAGNYQVNNAPDSIAGTGSAQVAGTSATGRLLGYMQCIHLPGPGTYALNGSARSEGNLTLSNPTALIWELRADGGEGCVDGPITAGGTHALGSQQSGELWIRPNEPALIDVSDAMWNHNTSLTVLMAVYPNASNTGYNGLFDRISLEPTGGPPFSDGFEAE